MKRSLMQESGCPNLIRNITKVTCQKSDVRGVITIPWSVLSESPPKALNVKEFQTHRKWVPKMRFVTVCGSRFLIFGFKSWKRYSFPCWSV